MLFEFLQKLNNYNNEINIFFNISLNPILFPNEEQQKNLWTLESFNKPRCLNRSK